MKRQHTHQSPVAVRYYEDGSCSLMWTSPTGSEVELNWLDAESLENLERE